MCSLLDHPTDRWHIIGFSSWGVLYVGRDAPWVLLLMSEFLQSDALSQVCRRLRRSLGRRYVSLAWNSEQAVKELEAFAWSLRSLDC